MEDVLLRNRFKRECDILIERLSILQNQVEVYKDLTNEIESWKNALIHIKKDISELNYQIDLKNAKIMSLGAYFLNIEWENKKLLKEIEKNKWKIVESNNNLKKQKEIHLKKLEQIKKQIEKQKHYKLFIDNEIKFKEKEFEDFKNNLKNEKHSLFKLVEENEKRLIEQRKEKEVLENNLNTLKKEYNELDKEYQQLMENYIIIQ